MSFRGVCTAAAVMFGCVPETSTHSCETPAVEPAKAALLPAWTEDIAWDATYRDESIGVVLQHPKRWTITPDAQRFETHGFMLRGEDPDPEDAHGPLPIARIAFDHSRKPDEIARIIRAKRDEYPEVSMRERSVMVGGHPAIALGPVPGGQVSTNVYFSVEDRVYRINYYGEELDARGQSLLDNLGFEPPTRRLELADPLSTSPVRIASSRRGLDPCAESADQSAVTSDEYEIAEGCWAQPTWFFIQTVHGADANGDGWTQMGTPNFWGENTHGAWGLGRCTSTYYTNDLYAIDYYLDDGDRLISPFEEGYVTYAGWDPENWWNYGNMVVISDPTGKFVSLSAHLSAVNVSAS